MRAARTATALLTTAVLALAATGCGGADADYREVPGAPVTVPIPSDSSTLGSDDGGDDAGADPDATTDPDAAATPEAGTTAPTDQSGATDTGAATGTGTDTGGTESAGTDSGGTTAPAQEDGPDSDSPPPAGSEAQQFEDFCAQNPGAC